MKNITYHTGYSLLYSNERSKDIAFTEEGILIIRNPVIKHIILNSNKREALAEYNEVLKHSEAVNLKFLGTKKESFSLDYEIAETALERVSRHIALINYIKDFLSQDKVKYLSCYLNEVDLKNKDDIIQFIFTNLPHKLQGIYLFTGT